MTSMEFDRLLLHISDQLDHVQLNDLKFLCHREIGRRDMEKVDRGTKLFQLLSERGALSPDNTEFLASRLNSINRADLAKTLHDFHCQSAFNDEEGQEKKELDMAIDAVAENLGKSWRKLGRKLGFKEAKLDSISMKHPADLEETARELLKEWRRNRGDVLQTSELIQALRACQLNMTADTVEETLKAAGFALT